MSTEERWLPVVGYEGYYEVSDHGRVRSVARTAVWSDGRRRHIPSCMRVLHPDPNGRLQLQLCADGVRRVRRVHQLVIEAFVGPAPDGLVCCHNDGNHLNNHISNLRWDSMSENQYDSVRHGTHWGARKTHCPRGHALEGRNAMTRDRGRSVHRSCRTCHNDQKRVQMRERAARKKDSRKKPAGTTEETA